MKRFTYIIIIIMFFALTGSVSFAQDPEARYSRPQSSWTDAEWDAEAKVSGEDYVNLKKGMWAANKEKVAQQKAAREASEKSRIEYENSQKINKQVGQATGVSKYIPCMVANDPNDPSRNEPSGLNCNSWQDLINVIQFFINSALVIATLLATVSFTYAGWLYLTSQGNMEQVKRAHGIFLKVLQGFIFMGIAYLLVKTILSTIAQSGYSLLQ